MKTVYILTQEEADIIKNIFRDINHSADIISQNINNHEVLKRDLADISIKAVTGLSLIEK